MSPENKSNLFPNLRSSYSQTELSELTGISMSKLRYWHNNGLLIPERYQRGKVKISYNQRLVAKAVFINILRDEGANMREVKHEVCKPGFISDNLPIIKNLLAKISNERSS